MIQSNELRIGNYVNLNDGAGKDDIREVLSIFANGITTRIKGCSVASAMISANQIYAIPLTEEILLKCGFVCFAESEVSKGFSIGTNPVTNDCMVMLTWLKDIFKNNLDNYPFFKNGHHAIKHLHQLQNLYFALTGEELEVNLYNKRFV